MLDQLTAALLEEPLEGLDEHLELLRRDVDVVVRVLVVQLGLRHRVVIHRDHDPRYPVCALELEEVGIVLLRELIQVLVGDEFEAFVGPLAKVD